MVQGMASIVKGRKEAWQRADAEAAKEAQRVQEEERAAEEAWNEAAAVFDSDDDAEGGTDGNEAGEHAKLTEISAEAGKELSKPDRVATKASKATKTAADIKDLAVSPPQQLRVAS
jgi:hypothetical protein